MADEHSRLHNVPSSLFDSCSSLFERDWTDIDVILTSFNLGGLALEDNPDYATAHAQCRASLQAADSSTLRQLAAYVLGPEITTPVLDTQPSDAADDLWGGGVVRVFLSHLASEREFVGEVSKELHRLGISSFVAHDSIDVIEHGKMQSSVHFAQRTFSLGSHIRSSTTATGHGRKLVGRSGERSCSAHWSR